MGAHSTWWREDEGKGTLFALKVPAEFEKTSSLPVKVPHSGSVSDMRPLNASSTQVFLSSTSLIENSLYSIVDIETKAEAEIIDSMSHDGSLFGLSKSQVSEIWFDGATDGQRVHAWLIRPSDFSHEKSYPLAYLVHGGPQGSWDDSWSTRWNPAVFAEQGLRGHCS